MADSDSDSDSGSPDFDRVVDAAVKELFSGTTEEAAEGQVHRRPEAPNGPIDLYPWTQPVSLPDDIRTQIRDAIRPVTRDGKRRQAKEDADGFLKGVESALFFFLERRGKWPRGPACVLPAPRVRDAKPSPTQTTYTEPLKTIANHIDEILKALDRLPTDSMQWIDEGVSDFLDDWGLEDAHPSADSLGPATETATPRD